MEKYVFISYCSQNLDYANSLAETLDRNKIHFYIDKKEIKGGDDWAKNIQDHIINCTAFVVLCSPESNASVQVLSELNIARCNKKAIIPIKIIDYDMYDAMYYHLSAYQILNGAYGINNQIIEDIILQLKNGVFIVNNNIRNDYIPPIDANIKGPVIMETKELLNKNYSVRYLSMKQVELDYLTVNPSKYVIDDEIEGTAENWLNLIGETEECSAQLVANNEVVGYMDFFPVLPKDFDLLVTGKPFSSDAVAYCYWGGEFDVYVSMFSMDYNYTTPSNYAMFFKWMVDKIIKWKEDGIIIDRIAFSVYLDSQAKALNALGFKRTFESPIKGMIYQTHVSDLLNHPVVVRQFLKK